MTALATAGRTLSSVFLPLAILLALAAARRRPGRLRTAGAAGAVLLFVAAYAEALRAPELSRWLYRLESPFVPAIALVVLPALFLPRTGAWRAFLLVPAAFLLLALGAIVRNLAALPAGTRFAWFLVHPQLLALGLASFLALAGRLLDVNRFRTLVRISTFLVLMYGGFAFRQSLADYQAMKGRRMTATADIANLSETSPVLRDADRLAYLPAAPCRFSADGGYVQGCVMELLQRGLQINWRRVAAGDPGEAAVAAIALAAAASILALAFAGARWWCGWTCPLSALGDGIDWARRRLGLPHVKTTPTIRASYLFSGLSFGAVGLLLASAVPHLDAQGRVLGCRIPLYPFCKLCPGQQLCPVAARGLAGYPPLPGTDWLFGLFRFGALALLALFVISFATGRKLWCRFCPMGMVGGLFNRGGLLALRKQPLKCNGCGACNEVCPMDIHSVARDMEHEDVSCFDCVYCLKCVAACPRTDCLRAELAGHPVAVSRTPHLAAPTEESRP